MTFATTNEGSLKGFWVVHDDGDTEVLPEDVTRRLIERCTLLHELGRAAATCSHELDAVRASELRNVSEELGALRRRGRSSCDDYERTSSCGCDS